jgi:outer membrane protein assembly factor BamE (lipoprotein component of BamABCDE complex)
MTVRIAIRAGWIRALVFGFTAFALASCSATYRNHGFTPSDDELAEIVVGVDTRDSVAETVGPPSSSGILDNSGYYYVSSRMRHYGIRAPEVVEREVVAISFTDVGVVQNIERFGLQDGRVVRLTRRVTSSSVANQPFLRQLLGNLGRFSPGQFLD